MAARLHAAARLACCLAAGLLLRDANGTRNEGQLVTLAREETAEVKRAFVDAGSSGSKYFAFCGTEEYQGKLTTTCASGLSEGIAALIYNPEKQCDGGKFQLNDDLGKLGKADHYAVHLLLGVQGAMDRLSGCAEGKQRIVPILATAGMRLISARDNRRVWTFICGQEFSGLQFPPPGPQCGTIPGTVEAYYEYLAYVIQLPPQDEPHKPSGIFSMGGASAQIALPLVSERDIASFGALIAKVREEIDCTAFKVASGDAAPMFTDPQSRSPNPKEACVGDYIAIREWKDVQGLTDEEAVNAGLVRRVGEALEPAVKGLGLISFLTLRGGGGLVAGGIFEVQHWAASRGCGGPRGDRPFEVCRQELAEALDKDVLWRNVRAYFNSGNVTIQSFSYNTPPAVPSNAFDPTDKKPGGGTPKPRDVVGRGQDQAWRLVDEIERECAPEEAGGHGGSWMFGWHRMKTCEGAYYQALYTTAFFMPEEQSELAYSDREISWTSGAIRMPVGSLLEADALLRLPLRRHSASYTAGAMRHFAAAAAV